MQAEDFSHLDQLLKTLVDAVSQMESIIYDEFVSNKELQYAVAYKIETAFKISQNISADIRDWFPKIPWRGMADWQEKLPENEELDVKLIWDVVTQDAVFIIFEVRDMLEILLDEE